MKKYLLLLLPALVCGDNLKTILDYAGKNNNLVQASKLIEDSRAQDIQTKENALYPSIDVGGNMQHLKELPAGQPGDIYSVYAKISYDIYDGGKKSSLVNSAKNDYKSSLYNYNATKDNLNLDVVQDFYLIKNLKGSLLAKQEAGKSLGEQLNRIKKYFEARLATKNDIDRIQSSYDTNNYETESIKFQIIQATKNLELKVGKNIDSIENSTFIEILENKFEENSNIKSMKAKRDALLSNIEVINSASLPQLKIENTYSKFYYGQTNENLPAGLDNQNNLTLTASMKLYDFGVNKSEKQSVMIQAQALSKEIDYKIEEQKIQNNISIARIMASKAKINSSQSALKAAKSAFEVMTEKYNAGLVDYVSYLDSLTSKTNAIVAHEISLNELQTAYAIYYYYNGKNLQDMINTGDLK
ncbi:MAG: TolC family protein [Arcobacteraceae bacterium]